MIYVFLLLSFAFATTNNTIDIDGVAPGRKTNDWYSDEVFPDTVISVADIAYFAWNATYCYFGIRDAELVSWKMHILIHLIQKQQLNTQLKKVKQVL